MSNKLCITYKVIHLVTKKEEPNCRVSFIKLHYDDTCPPISICALLVVNSTRPKLQQLHSRERKRCSGFV